MTVKVGEDFSTLRALFGRVPQGSILGVFLFNCTMDDFEAAAVDIEPYLVNGGANHGTVRQLEVLDIPGLVQVPDKPHDPATHMPPWQNEKLQTVKYVDDNTLHEKINMENAEVDEDTGDRVKHAPRTQNTFRTVIHRAGEADMQINP